MSITKKVAVFEDQKYKFQSVFDDRFENARDYVRVTEYEEITFSPRAADEMLSGQLAALDVIENEVRCELSMKLEDIKRRRAELLCLTGPSAVAEDVL